MTTTWTGSPVLSAASINELRQAVDAAGGSPDRWTGGSRLPEYTTLTAEHILEIKRAIQRLWDERGLGLIPNWTLGVEPGDPIPGTPLLLIRDQDIYDLRKWFNHYETWGDLRGVHWWKDTTPAGNSVSALPKVGWNVELVYGVSNSNGTYNGGEVAKARRHCVAARNYGLVNIVRIDWKGGSAVPTDSNEYTAWKNNFNQAVNALKDVATIFVVGNEPTIEPEVTLTENGKEVEHNGITSTQYADAFNSLYREKVAGVTYLAAGPASCSVSNPVVGDDEVDVDWLENASRVIMALDGWALHAYGAPYLDYAGKTDDSDEKCNTATVDCPIDRDIHKPQNSPLTDTGDAGFRRHMNFIDRIRRRWAAKPVYITETNTSGYKANFQNTDGDTSKLAPPSITYVAGWIQTTYQEIRKYNRQSNTNRYYYPRIMCLCWFVDDHRNDDNWRGFALSNGATYDMLGQARADFKASDTSTGIEEISGRGRIPLEVPDPRWPGVSQLCPTTG